MYLIMILFFGPTDLPDNMYISFIRLEINDSIYRLVNTGVIGLIGVYFIVRKVYQKQMILEMPISQKFLIEIQ